MRDLCSLNNLMHFDNEKVKKAIFQAELDGKSNYDIQGLADKEVASLIRSGFKLCYNGMFGMYRIEWGV